MDTLYMYMNCVPGAADSGGNISCHDHGSSPHQTVHHALHLLLPYIA